MGAEVQRVYAFCYFLLMLDLLELHYDDVELNDACLSADDGIYPSSMYVLSNYCTPAFSPLVGGF